MWGGASPGTRNNKIDDPLRYDLLKIIAKGGEREADWCACLKTKLIDEQAWS